ncbi:MAG: hypothetical protein JRE65_09635 [Deltaproteobacteria bacterium]|jgi:hypothetical protein|nr:hypothetical protein [Deltaproteobacteria bacterium]
MNSKNLKVLFLFSAIIIFSFHNNLQALQKGIERYKRKELDQVTIYEKKFIELKAFLQDHMVVGYVSDYDDNSDEDGMAYGMTQYVLAPIILVRGKKRNFIVGNFHSANPNIKAYEEENLSLYRDFGNGVILFQRVDN